MNTNAAKDNYYPMPSKTPLTPPLSHDKDLPLLDVLYQQIQASDGFLPFDVLMQHALYHDVHGYYQQGHVFGASGDFITAPDMGPWLALAFADLIHHGWQHMGSPPKWGLLEQGGGRGRLLSQVVRLLGEHFKQSPTHIFAVEKSALWRAEQAKHYQQAGISVIGLASLDALSIDVPLLIFSNELPDAFPVRCFVWQQGQCFERAIIVDGTGTLGWGIADVPFMPAPTVDNSIMQAWPEGYISEYNTGLAAWQRQLGELLTSNGGMAFTLDYGYSQSEYYRPSRIEGTLMGHKGHQVMHDVLTHIGEADMTAHVDFTALARIGMAHGLTAIAYMTQGGWLASSPLVQTALQEVAATPNAQNMRLIAHAKRLMLPHAGMGESFKLLIQSPADVVLPDPLQAMNRLERLRIEG
ncbi:MAG: SAM-dependent methyltransferase [Mariprofundaceae bacterium]|nr:SAM-dependent methyltransferase [Mariprofundaceae bacterium]